LVDGIGQSEIADSQVKETRRSLILQGKELFAISELTVLRAGPNIIGQFVVVLGDYLREP
jgi:hypothetical protein